MTDQPQKPHRKLTKKERLFVREYAKTENGTQSALKAYDVNGPKVAGVIAVENLAKPRIQEAVKLEIRRLADRIPDELLEQKHLELINKVDKEGELDVQAVSKGLDMAYKLKGAYGEQLGDSSSPHNVYNFFFNKQAQEEAKMLEDKIKNALLQKPDDRQN